MGQHGSNLIGTVRIRNASKRSQHHLHHLHHFINWKQQSRIINAHPHVTTVCKLLLLRFQWEVLDIPRTILISYLAIIMYLDFSRNILKEDDLLTIKKAGLPWKNSVRWYFAQDVHNFVDRWDASFNTHGNYV